MKVIKAKLQPARQWNKKLLSLLSKYFRILPFAAALLIFVLAWAFLLKPKYESIQALINELENEQTGQIEIRQRYLDNLKLRAGEKNKADEVSLEKINQMFPDGPDIDGLMIGFESIVHRNGLALSSIGFSSEKGTPESKNKKNSDKDEDGLPEGIQMVKINLSVSGVNYYGLKRLLASLENNVRLFDVQEINFKPDTLEAQLVINTYYISLKQ